MKVKEICQNMEKKEIDEFNKKNYESIKNKMFQIIKRLNNEMEVLRQKINNERNMLIKDKDSLLEKLIQKYKNRKHDIMSKQTTEKFLSFNENMKKYRNIKDYIR